MFDTTARFWAAKHAGGPFSDRDYEDKLQRVMARGVDMTVALQSLARYVSKVYSWLVVVQYVSYKSKNGNVKTVLHQIRPFLTGSEAGDGLYAEAPTPNFATQCKLACFDFKIATFFH